MIRGYKVPTMILIDGLDGSGKNTISTQMRNILTDAGYRVFKLDSPDYDSPAGQMVMDYLTKGYGQIKDRSITSLYYTLDRQNYLRDHFDEIFRAEPGYDFIIANRWTLSSLLYQTTVLPQKPAYSLQCTHQATTSDAGDNLPRSGRTYTIHTNHGLRVHNYNLEELYHKVHWMDLHDPHSPEHDELTYVMNHVRAQLVREHANLLYRLEMMPWWIERDGKSYVPFANFRSIVLVPDMGTVRKNLLKRAGDDEEKLDQNETNTNFLKSVAENIHWIHAHESLIFAYTCPDSDNHEMEPIVSVEGAIRALNRRGAAGQDYFLLSPAQLMPIESVEAPARAFEYQIIETSEFSDEGALTQKSKEAVLREVWDALHLSFYHQLTKRDCIFPDD